MSGRGLMRAIRVAQFGGPEVLKIDFQVPVPVPTDTQVLVEVKAAGVNPVDTYIRNGTYAVKPPLPYTPGAVGAGIVSQVGASVTKFKVGLACVQIGVAGLRVHGTAGTPDLLDLMLKQGATGAFSYKEQGYTDKILAAINAAGPDIIIEMTANVNLETGLKIINKGGIIVVGGI